MRLQTNLNSLYALRNLTQTNRFLTKSTAKLSSGLRISGAADDAAGLAISQKMRAQISGLFQSKRNVQDGISLIQTADGALGKMQDNLQRMRELALQSANGILTGAERDKIQREIYQLTTEIDMIAGNTKFNTKPLLDGSFMSNFKIGANLGENIELKIAGMTANDLNLGETRTTGLASNVTGSASAVEVSMGTYQGENADNIQVDTSGLVVDLANTVANVQGSAQNISSADISGSTGSAIVDQAEIGISVSKNEATPASVVGKFTLPAPGESTKINVMAGSSGGQTTIYNDSPYYGTTTIDDVVNDLNKWISGVQASSDGTNITLSTTATGSDAELRVWDGGGIFSTGTYSGKDTTYDVEFDNGTGETETKRVAENTSSVSGSGAFAGLMVDFGSTVTADTKGTIGLVTPYGGSINVGGTSVNIGNDGTGTVSSGDYKGLNVNVRGAYADQTGSFNISGIEIYPGCDVSTQETAEESISIIDKALEQVSNQRSDLGSVQNRLEYSINSLGKFSENLQAAESRLRDLNMAQEMMHFARNEILERGATAVLAQANHMPQSVLQLLG